MALDRHSMKLFARSGYASRGVIYLIVGFFAVLAAFGAGQEKDTKGALRTLLEQPFGTALVWLLLVGLAGYVFWRLVQALFDTDDHGLSPKGLAVRAGLLASALTYATLGAYALSLLGVLPYGGGDERSVADIIAGVVGTKIVLLVLTLVFAGVAIAHWYKALTRRYADHFEASERAMRLVHPVSMLGLIARGSVFAVIAVLLFYRFRTVAPSDEEPPGLGAVLDFVQGLPGGGWLLAALGAGLMLFSAYSFLEALWRRINVEDA